MSATVFVQNFGGVSGLNGILKDVSPDERAAILKARFAGTIAKANGGKSSRAKKEDEEERKRQERKRRWAEAKIKALKRKEEIKKEGELKRKREEEREAARKALEVVERNVVVVDNFAVTSELVGLVLGGGSAWYNLGLRRKEEEEADDDEYDGCCKKTKI